jgi:hypothetical protein
MSSSNETKKVKFTVEKNERYGDHRVVEYVDGEWNNERDNGWSKYQAEKLKTNLTKTLKQLNGAMVIPSTSDTALYIA